MSDAWDARLNKGYHKKATLTSKVLLLIIMLFIKISYSNKFFLIV